MSQGSQAERIQQIEKKLKLIAETKSTRSKEEKANNTTLRVINIEKLYHDLSSRFEL